MSDDMIKLEALKELAAKVEAGDANYYPGQDFHLAMGGNSYDYLSKTPGSLDMDRAYHGSLDAAKALHEAVLPGWVAWDKSHTYFGYEIALTNGDKDARSCSKVSEARAWLLAIIKALIAEEEGK